MKISPLVDQIPGSGDHYGRDGHKVKQEQQSNLFPDTTHLAPLPSESASPFGVPIVAGPLAGWETSIREILTETEITTLQLLFDHGRREELLYGQQTIHSVDSGHFIDITA